MNRELHILNHLGLVPGDSITVPKSLWGVEQLHALYLRYDDFGRHYMCENVIGKGVKLTRVEDFFKGVTKVTSLKKFRGSNFDRKQLVQKALAKPGQPYHLINYNCEHFINDVLFDAPDSKQVKNVLQLVGGK